MHASGAPLITIARHNSCMKNFEESERDRFFLILTYLFPNKRKILFRPQSSWGRFLPRAQSLDLPESNVVLVTYRSRRGRMHSCELEDCGAPPRRAALVLLKSVGTSPHLTSPPLSWKHYCPFQQTFCKTGRIVHVLHTPQFCFWESLDEQVCISQILWPIGNKCRMFAWTFSRTSLILGAEINGWGKLI